MHGSFAAGRILNAKTARSQCLGGMTFGIGMALTEELAFDPRDGHVANHNLAEYHIAVNADVPQLTVELLEERDDWATRCRPRALASWVSAVQQQRLPMLYLTRPAFGYVTILRPWIRLSPECKEVCQREIAA